MPTNKKPEGGERRPSPENKQDEAVNPEDQRKKAQERMERNKIWQKGDSRNKEKLPPIQEEDEKPKPGQS